MSDLFLAPSILSADFSRLGEEVENVLTAGADIVHFDVMDNHFVPNLTIGPMVCSALRNYGIVADIDVHLMIEPVDRIVPDFAEAGASYITFHPEASQNIGKTLQLIKQQGCKAGLVLNPTTPLSIVAKFIDQLDMLLLMSVTPGFAGQAFIPETLEKITQARAMIADTGKPIRLEVDGGIKATNIAAVAQAGADTFVAGSAIFGHQNVDDPNKYDSIIAQMRDELTKVPT